MMLGGVILNQNLQDWDKIVRIKRLSPFLETHMKSWKSCLNPINPGSNLIHQLVSRQGEEIDEVFVANHLVE